MAFTDAQKVQIRQFLGYPLGYYQYNYPVESMILKIGDVAAEQAAVEAILAQLATADAAFIASGASGQAAGLLKRVDEVEFYGATESGGSMSLIGAQRLGRVLVGRLADALGGREYIHADYFAASSTNSFPLAMG